MLLKTNDCLINFIKDMENTADKDPRERIIDASATLFAQRGFAAVGVREIAARAEVNISMISYYFGGKIGILKEIIKTYYTELRARSESSKLDCCDFEASLRNFIDSTITLMKTKSDLCKVAIFEMPYDLPEILEFKINLMREQQALIKNKFHSGGTKDIDPKLQVIIGPAFFSLIFSNFLLGNVAAAGSKVEFDDDFYKLYSEIISTLFISGIHGVAKLTKSKNQNKHKTGNNNEN